jgi:endonuclease/exonuclease/phosphatase (EEP) superfamily protein YafD
VVVAAGGWFAFVAAHLALSGRVYWWTAPDLAPPLVFVVVPAVLALAVPLARRVRGRVRVTAGVLLAASLALGWSMSGANAATLWHTSPPAPAGAVTVFSWNTYRWDELIGGAHLAPADRPRDTDGHYRYLRAQRADIYLLQETFTYGADDVPTAVDQFDRLRREVPGYHIAVSGELTTLSRFPIMREVPLDLQPWLSRPKADLVPSEAHLPAYYSVKTLRTDVRVSGRVVSFYNSHIHVPMAGLSALDPRKLGDSRQRFELRLADLRAISADVEANRLPVVLAGDLNSSPAMGLLRALPDTLDDAIAAHDSVYPISWAWLGAPLWRLDWAFTSDEVTVHRYRIVPAGMMSDHRGQHLTVSVPRCPGGNPCV